MKICLDCGNLAVESRCPSCKRSKDAARRPRPTYQVRNGERARREAVVRAWIQVHGYVCPGYEVPAHPVVAPNILTADHVIPAMRGGTVLAVLCRVCNGRKGGGVSA